MEKVTVVQQNVLGGLWAIGWLFSIGYLQMRFWQGVKAIFIWPYYMGKKFRKE
jgi:hypothetical protein